MAGIELPGFDVVRRVGEGVSGAVYLAKDEKLGRDVALKVFKQGIQVSSAYERFRREAELLAQHPCEVLVPIYDARLDHDPPFLVFRWMDGGDLAGRMRRVGVFPEIEIARIGLRVAQGLEHLHSKGILHRDLKPENLLLDERNEVFVADLGLGMAATHDPLTRTGFIVGTPRYMPPETVEQGEYSDQGDLFALGAILLELALGRRLRRPPDVLRFLEKDLAVPVGPEMEAILRRCLRTSPAARYPTATDLAEDLLPIASRSTSQVPMRGPAREAPTAPRPAAADATASRVEAAPAPDTRPARDPDSTALSAQASLERVRPAPLWPRVVVAMALVTAGFLVFQESLRPPAEPPAPRVPPDPATLAAGREREAREKLVASLARFGGHPDKGTMWKRVREDPLPVLLAYGEPFCDPAYTLRWTRFFDALTAWLQVRRELPAAARDAPEGTAVWTEVVLPRAHRELDAFLNVKHLTRKEVGESLLGATLGRATQMLEVWVKRHAEILDALVILERDLRARKLLDLPAEILVTDLDRFLEGVGKGSRGIDILPRIEAAFDTDLFAPGMEVAFQALIVARKEGTFPCEELDRRYAAFDQVVAREHRRALRDGTRPRVSNRVLIENVHLALECGDDVAPGSIVRARDNAERIVPLEAVAPGYARSVVRDAARQVRLAGVSGEPSRARRVLGQFLDHLSAGLERDRAEAAGG